jgi:hypothetical protein
VPTLEIILALAVLYLVECLMAVRRDGMLLWSWLRRSARLTHAHALPGAPDWGVFLGVPLPPFRGLCETRFYPLSLSPLGISTSRAQRVGLESLPAETPRHVAFAEIRKVGTDGRYLTVNGERLADCGSEAGARCWEARARELTELPEQARAAAIKAVVTRGLDTGEVARVLTASRAAVRNVRWDAHLLFFFLFVFTPLVLFEWGLERNWIFLAAGLLILWARAVYGFFRAHQGMYPERRGDRRHETLVMALTPMAALRAPDLLTRHSLVGFHPLAVVHALADATRFREFARKALCDLRYPLAGTHADSEGSAADIAGWFRTCLLEVCEPWLADVGCVPADLLAPPAADDAESRGYCLRCRTQLVHAEGECPWCGVALCPLEGNTAAEVSASAGL